MINVVFYCVVLSRFSVLLYCTPILFNSTPILFHAIQENLAIPNHISVAGSYRAPNVLSRNSNQSLNTHTPPSVSLSVIALETDLIVWTSVSQTGPISLYLWLLYLLLAGIY